VPRRLPDARSDQSPPGPRGELGTIDAQALGVGDIPASGVSAIVVEVIATEAAAAGVVTGHPLAEERPLPSNVDLDRAGATALNLAVVPVGMWRAPRTTRLTCRAT